MRAPGQRADESEAASAWFVLDVPFATGQQCERDSGRNATRSFPVGTLSPVSYAVLVHGAKAFCLDEEPRQFVERHGCHARPVRRRLVLRAGPGNTRGAIDAARWNATAASDTHCGLRSTASPPPIPGENQPWSARAWANVTRRPRCSSQSFSLAARIPSQSEIVGTLRKIGLSSWAR